MDTVSKIGLPSLEIVKYPDPVLRGVCAEVTSFDADLRSLAERMFEILYAARGVGLAAPQVGLAIRMFVMNPEGEPGDQERVCVNPRIVDPDGLAVAEEGCLSLPGISAKVKRFAAATLHAQDLAGEPFELPAEGLVARIVQHETDHLNGVLLIDRMSPVSKFASRRALENLENAYEKRRRP